MNHFRLITILFPLLASSPTASAQGAFSAAPDTVTAVKPANIFVFYNYAVLANLMPDTLRMRWVKTEVVASNRTAGPGEPPLGNWSTAIQDPDTYYNPAEGVDSADFVLPPEDTGRLFIFQLFPAGEAGTISARFKFFPVDDPADSLFVTFQFNATPVFSSVSGVEAGAGIAVFPNPARGSFTIRNTSAAPREVAVLTATGRALARYRLLPGQEKVVDTSGLPSGAYFIRDRAGDRVSFRKVVVGQR